MITLKMKELLENEFSINIGFKNLTSGTSLNYSPQMITFTLNTCSLVLPIKSCSVKHKVLLIFSVSKKHEKKKSPKQKTEVIGIIQEVIPITSNSLEVNVQFNQFIKEEWQSIVDSYEYNQEQIFAVFQKLKEL